MQGETGTRRLRWALALTLALACAHTATPTASTSTPVEPAPPTIQSTDQAPRNEPPPPALDAEAPTDDLATLIEGLTLEQKVGQVMMVGFAGLEVDARVATLIQGYHVGGVCLFARNIHDAQQVARLNDDVRALLSDRHELPPFIAVDQEGGNVVRLSDGNLVLPGNMVLGATRDPALAREAGRAQGADLRRLGFNMNLAPVLDVNVNPHNPVIGMRAFSDNVDLVSELGQAFVAGQADARIVTVAKHFPGHGGVDADSHKKLPIVHASATELRAQLKPFSAAMAAGLDGVMTAHVAAPAISGDELPATLSAPVLSGLLRRELGFKGLVLTDELEMQAIDGHWGVGRAAVMALNAGADMVLVPWRPERKTEVWEALLAAARSGELPLSRLDDAVHHIVEAKARRGVLEPQPERRERLAGLGADKALADTIARAGVTLLKAAPGRFPLLRTASSGAKGPVAGVLATSGVRTQRIAVITAERSLSDAVRRRVPSASVLVTPAFPAREARDELKRSAQRAAEEADLVIVGVVNGNQVELVTNAALAGKPTIVVVMGVPYLASMVPTSVSTIVAVYSYQPAAAEAAVAALFGERGTPGRLPVALPRMPFGTGLNPVGRLAGAPGATTVRQGATFAR